VIAAWLSAVLIPVAAVGVAGAAGIIPAGARDAFGWPYEGNTDPDTNMDLSTARLVFTEPGLDSRTFQVWTARGPNGYFCVSFALTPTISVADARDRQAPPGGSMGGGCAQPGKHPDTFAAADVSSGTQFAVTAGGSVRGRLRLPDGTVRDLSPQNGWFAGWLVTGTPFVGAVLTGYAADGSALGSVQPFGAPPTP
jgi:hypothetical protein